MTIDKQKELTWITQTDSKPQQNPIKRESDICWDAMGLFVNHHVVFPYHLDWYIILWGLMWNTVFIHVGRKDLVIPRMVQIASSKKQQGSVWGESEDGSEHFDKYSWFGHSIDTETQLVMILQWRHNERDSLSKHRRLDCLQNTPKLRVTSLCEWNPPVTGRSHSLRASNAENVAIWWTNRGTRSSADKERVPLYIRKSSHDCYDVSTPWYLECLCVQANNRKHGSSALLALVRESTGDQGIAFTKSP